MNQDQYTKEQQKDIEDRVAKAQEALKELQLQPAAQIYKINMGDDVFGDRLIPYLQDLKYSPTLSPIQDV